MTKKTKDQNIYRNIWIHSAVSSASLTLILMFSLCWTLKVSPHRVKYTALFLDYSFTESRS